jgi:hypothetical protein
MTLEQLEDELPNGLHDAQIRSIARNFENGTLALGVRILVGLPGHSPGERDEYRNGCIMFTGVQLCVTETPDAASAFPALGSVTFSASRSEADLFPANIVERLTPGIDMYSLFVLDWHSHIHIAASNISFHWDRPSDSSP